jgi:hypothetical protein
MKLSNFILALLLGGPIKKALLIDFISDFIDPAHAVRRAGSGKRKLSGNSEVDAEKGKRFLIYNSLQYLWKEGWLEEPGEDIRLAPGALERLRADRIEGKRNSIAHRVWATVGMLWKKGRIDISLTITNHSSRTEAVQ